MFTEYKVVYSDSEIEEAKERYCNAVSLSIKGSAGVFMKRQHKDIFINNFNPNLMRLHEVNHDIQIVIDQYACAEYVCGYLTKNEAGINKTLEAINNEAKDLSNMQLLNKLATALDKNREVSIFEAVYRLLGLPMTKN